MPLDWKPWKKHSRNGLRSVDWFIAAILCGADYHVRPCHLAIFIIVYGRMIEIYLMVSLAPIPFSTFANREQNQIGQNYLRSLFALGFQGF